jgi:hypothetical protein
MAQAVTQGKSVVSRCVGACLQAIMALGLVDGPRRQGVPVPNVIDFSGVRR